MGGGGGGEGGWTIQMATMVINSATNMKIAAKKAALQNLRSWINNKTGQEIALGQVFKGTVRVKVPEKENEIFLFFLFYYARQARNFKNQMFLTSKYKSASMV